MSLTADMAVIHDGGECGIANPTGEQRHRLGKSLLGVRRSGAQKTLVRAKHSVGPLSSGGKAKSGWFAKYTKKRKKKIGDEPGGEKEGQGEAVSF